MDPLYLTRNNLLWLFCLKIMFSVKFCFLVAECSPIYVKSLHLLNLKKQQSKWWKIMYKLSRSSSRPLFDSSKILPFDKTYLYKIGISMFKLYDNFIQGVCNDMFTRNILYLNYSTWNKDSFHILKVKTNLCEHSIRYQGAIIHNHFIKNIEFNCSIITYECRLKAYLLSNDLSF